MKMSNSIIKFQKMQGSVVQYLYLLFNNKDY